MPVGDEDVAVRRGHHRGWRVELIGRAAGLVRLAKHEQHLAVRAELEHLVALAAAAEPVGHPDVARTVDVQAMRKQQQAGAEALDQLAGAIELEDRVERRLTACKRRCLRIDARGRSRFTTALGDPDAGAVGIDADRAGRAPGPPLRKLAPVLDRPVRIGRRVGRRHGLAQRIFANEDQRDRGDPKYASRECRGVHGVSPLCFVLLVVPSRAGCSARPRT